MSQCVSHSPAIGATLKPAEREASVCSRPSDLFYPLLSLRSSQTCRSVCVWVCVCVCTSCSLKITLSLCGWRRWKKRLNLSRRLQDYFKPSCHARTVRDCGSNRTPVSVNVTLLFTLLVDAEDELRNVSSPLKTDSSELFSAPLSRGDEQNGAETSRL